METQKIKVPIKKNQNIPHEETDDFIELFEGSDMFYLADPTDLTFKKNGGTRWGTKKEFRIPLAKAIEGHLDGTLKKGVVLPPIRKSDNKCKWGAIDVDGNIYNYLCLCPLFKENI